MSDQTAAVSQLHREARDLAIELSSSMTGTCMTTCDAALVMLVVASCKTDDDPLDKLGRMCDCMRDSLVSMLPRN